MSTLLAYIDPAAGGILLQIILGGFAAVFLGVQLFWGRILRLFGFRRKEDPPAEES